MTISDSLVFISMVGSLAEVAFIIMIAMFISSNKGEKK